MNPLQIREVFNIDNVNIDRTFVHKNTSVNQDQ